MNENSKKLLNIMIAAKRDEPLYIPSFSEYLAEYLDAHGVIAPKEKSVPDGMKLCGIDGYSEYIYTPFDEAEALLRGGNDNGKA